MLTIYLVVLSVIRLKAQTLRRGSVRESLDFPGQNFKIGKIEKSEMGNWKSEMGNWKSEIGNRSDFPGEAFNMQLKRVLSLGQMLVSSTNSTFLPRSTSGSGVYFSRALSARLVPSMKV